MKTNIIALSVSALLSACVSSPGPARGLPKYWETVALGSVSPEADSSRASTISEELGIALEGGAYLGHTGNVSQGIEAFIGYSKHDASTTVIDPVSGIPLPLAESPTNVEAGIGTRVVFGTGAVLPFVRLGAMYQYLADDLIDDSGFGFYVGAGVDLRASENATIGPFVRYSSTSLDRFDIEEVVWGLRFSVLF